MMNARRILELLEYEHECVKRNCEGKCDRECGYCDLVQVDKDLLELYSTLIKEYRFKAKMEDYGESEEYQIRQQMYDDWWEAAGGEGY